MFPKSLKALHVRLKFISLIITDNLIFTKNNKHLCRHLAHVPEYTRPCQHTADTQIPTTRRHLKCSKSPHYTTIAVAMVTAMWSHKSLLHCRMHRAKHLNTTVSKH
ncbi:unnamed protein product [Ceratitis capitata]|uniref:(Mediterranean fruit fly) hypothetical protein n=1 Tax=Ceratitis capitata TaxID=7213 RepID=A0A811U945_CERCA|nr:unnamed protein product [Ceratitis capitata]